MNVVTWADLDAVRESSYRLHSSALLPPDPDRVAAWARIADQVDEAGPEAFAFASAWRRLRERLQSPPEDLASEYVRLFDAGVDGALCPPYESHWLSAARRGGPAHLSSELEREYRTLGLSVSRRGSVTADHVATEFEVATFLCRAEADAHLHGDLEAASAARRREVEFLDRHLARWLPRFAGRLAAVAPDSFYRSVTDSAAAFVRHDRDLLGALSAEPEMAGTR